MPNKRHAVHTKKWYIASTIEIFEFDNSDKKNPNRRCIGDQNYYLIQASSCDEAYQKAVRIGEAANGIRCMILETGQMGETRFIGLSNLLPIYEKMADGAEIMWDRIGYKSFRNIQSMVQGKASLKAQGREFEGHNTKSNRRELDPSPNAPPRTVRRG